MTPTDRLLAALLAALDHPHATAEYKLAQARRLAEALTARRRAARLRRGKDALLCAYTDAAMRAKGRPDPDHETEGV